MDKDYYKSRLVRTPLEVPLSRLLHLSGWFNIRKHPEMREVYLESGRVEAAIRRLVREDSNCIDVGCHLGSMLSLLLRLAPRGKHTAIEPIPRKAEWLRRKFPEVEIKQVALGETSGRVTFYESLTRSGFSGLRKTGDDQDVVNETLVDVERLDQLVDPKRRIGFIKIDVEGAEFLALKGASELILRDRPSVLFESVPEAVEKFGQTRRDFYDFLTGTLGFSIYLAKDFLAGTGPLTWDRFDASHHYPFQAMNYLAIPKEAP